MKKTSFFVLTPVFIGFLLSGCAGNQAKAIKLTVPYVAQNPDDCGAATLSMILKYYNIEVPLAEIEHALFVPALQGTTPELIADYSAQKGVAMRKSHEKWPFLVNKLEQGVPTIVFFGPTKTDSLGHFSVVTGMNRRKTRIRLHNGPLKDRWMLQNTFMELWGRGRYTVLWPDAPQHLGVAE